MTATSMLHIRIDDQVKQRATAALASMGLSTSDAVRMLFHRIVADQAFPLELKVPNAETRAAIAEVDAMTAARFATGDELMAALESSNV
jgi:DNA-damage-inducible protein J